MIPTPAIPADESVASRRTSHRFGRRRLAVALIVIAILATFGRIVAHDFVGGWDDDELIVDNPMIDPPTLQGLGKIWTTPHIRMYIPAVYSTWWLLAEVARVPGQTPGTMTLNPYAYHAANLLVHILSALIVFAILELLIARIAPARGDRLRHRACALGALAFALHPLQVEAVAWATGMKDLLSGMLALLAIWLYLRSSASTTPRGQWIAYSLAMVAFILALLAKPSTVVVPLILIALEGLVIHPPIRSMFLRLIPWLILAAFWSLVTTRVQPTPELIGPPVVHRLLTAADALGFYIVKLVWPARLGIDYGLRPDVIVHTMWWIAALVCAIVIAMFPRRWVLASALIFVLGVLPVLGLTPFVFQWLSTTADRYIYISMLGPAIIVASIVAIADRAWLAWAFAGVIAALGIRSFVQCGVWRNDKTLMTHELTINPRSPLANNSLGHLLFTDGYFSQARERFAIAVKEKPDYLMARDNLAVALAATDQTDRAIDLMKQTLAMRRKLPPPIRQSINPDLARLATFLEARGRYAEAAGYLRELAKLEPNDAGVKRRLDEAQQLASPGSRPATHPDR